MMDHSRVGCGMIAAAVFAGTILAMDGCAGPRPMTLDELGKASYAGIFEEPVRLRDGTYEGPPFVEGGASRPRLVLWPGPTAFGELDELAGVDAAVLLSETSGGSGEHVYLAVATGERGASVVEATFFVGDRTKVRSLAIVDGHVVLDVVEAGEGDPACCPTRLARKSYALREHRLEMTASATQGTLSLEVLGDRDWVLASAASAELAAGEIEPAQRPTVRFDDGRIAGFGGCNRYSAGVEEHAPGRLSVGPIAATRMACPKPQMDLESSFLGRLEQIESYTFLAGRLALVWREDTRSGILSFEPRSVSAAKSASEPAGD